MKTLLLKLKSLLISVLAGKIITRLFGIGLQGRKYPGFAAPDLGLLCELPVRYLAGLVHIYKIAISEHQL